MGLRIIYGKAGSGKSQYIYNEINNKKNNMQEDKITDIRKEIKAECKTTPSPKETQFIITPEQFSFTAEQKLMENRKSIIGAEVITFNRLWNKWKNKR